MSMWVRKEMPHKEGAAGGKHLRYRVRNMTDQEVHQTPRMRERPGVPAPFSAQERPDFPPPRGS